MGRLRPCRLRSDYGRFVRCGRLDAAGGGGSPEEQVNRAPGCHGPPKHPFAQRPWSPEDLEWGCELAQVPGRGEGRHLPLHELRLESATIPRRERTTLISFALPGTRPSSARGFSGSQKTAPVTSPAPSPFTSRTRTTPRTQLEQSPALSEFASPCFAEPSRSPKMSRLTSSQRLAATAHRTARARAIRRSARRRTIRTSASRRSARSPTRRSRRPWPFRSLVRVDSTRPAISSTS